MDTMRAYWLIYLIYLLKKITGRIFIGLLPYGLDRHDTDNKDIRGTSAHEALFS